MTCESNNPPDEIIKKALKTRGQKTKEMKKMGNDVRIIKIIW